MSAFNDLETVSEISAVENKETDKTDVTDLVTNSVFLQTLFGSSPAEEKPVVVSFPGDPHTIPKNLWFGKGWDSQTAELSDLNNNYFSIATFQPDEERRYRRISKKFRSLSAIVLDDVGTKISKDLISLEPSWKLETSEDNYQYGYILSVPITDPVEANTLMKAVIDSGFCDKGAGGPTARIVRLPQGCNGKNGKTFRCRMSCWQPERRFSTAELYTGLNIDLRAAKVTDNDSVRPDGTEGIFIPCPTENPILKGLRERNLYKSPLGEGKHDITCPWCASHTDGVDTGSAYFEPNFEFPIGGFHCFHGHCEDKGIRNLLEFLDVAVQAARMKPTIKIVEGQMPNILCASEQTLAASGSYWQRGGLIVTVSTDPGTLQTSVRPLNRSSLTYVLSSMLHWEKFKAGQMLPSDPPERHCGILLDASEYKFLPILNGLAYQPYLRPDGTIVHQPGYDQATGMFGIFEADKFFVPDKPTQADAEKALNLLRGVLDEFPFKSSVDEATALSLLLTAAVRPSLSLAPMFHAQAPEMGSGKSSLMQIATGMATPSFPATVSFPKDDVECEKLLLAHLASAPPVLNFDNLTTDLYPLKSLCSALTSEHMTGRILGVSKTMTVNTRALFLSSGNNVGPIKDMGRRCMVIHLQPTCETPATRVFKKPNLLSEFLKCREEYVSATLTIIRAWIANGRPKTECRSIAGYQDWSEICRQPLLWLGVVDPVQSMFETMTEDPERETLGRMLEAWHEKYGTSPKMIREAIKDFGFTSITNPTELQEVFQEIAGERDLSINRRSLGRWMKRNSGRIVSGKRLVNASGKRSSEAWRVENV